jgi:endonuclease/exonuclease/phosphatase family metal-dependent hydrolase
VTVCLVAATLMPSNQTTMASPDLVRTASTSVNLRFGSFNVQSVGVDRTEGERRPWKARRGTVIKQILSEEIDVLGVQEVNPSSYFAPRLVDGTNQFLDLRNGLNKAGGHYALTKTVAWNCVNPNTGYKCRYRNRAASGSERILYDTRKLSLLYSGSMAYRAQQSSKGGAYLAWAWLRSKDNGHKFLFTTTHLDPTHRNIRLAQWRELIARVNTMNRGYPVVAVGDFNMQKFDPMAAEMLPAMKKAGYGDVLNQEYAVNPPHGVRARTRINAWLSTLNHLNRDLTASGYSDRRDKLGNGIDYIFASNRLTVQDYKVVVDFNPSTLRINDTLPSDHNLIRSTITIP